MTDKHQHDHDTDSGAWTTGSGEPVSEPETPPANQATSGTTAEPPGTAERSARGTDQESPMPGMSKPASKAAEMAPPDAAPGPRDT